jgi:hypothetical protein
MTPADQAAAKLARMSFEPVPELPIRKISAADSPPPPMPRPKLSIAHLMLWTLGTAIALALSRAQIAAFELTASDLGGRFALSRLGTYFRTAVIVIAPFTGIAVALVIAVAWRICRRQSLPLSQPGHWILLVGGILYVLNALAETLQARIEVPVESQDLEHVMWVALLWLPHLPVYVTAAGLLFLAWRSTVGPPRWRFVFASNLAVYVFAMAAAVIRLCSMASGELMWIVTFPLALIAIPIYLAWLISFPLAVLRDLWLKDYRDALHWSGVLLVIVWVLTTLAYFVAVYSAVF